MQDPKRHIFVPWRPTVEPFRSPGQVGHAKLPERGAGHGELLKSRLETAYQEVLERRQDRVAAGMTVPDGVILDIRAEPGFELTLDQLDLPSFGVELCSTRTVDGTMHAAVFVPDGAMAMFLGRFEEYLTVRTEKGRPAHQQLVDSISDLRLATIEAFWTEPAEPFPDADQKAWFEVWLRDATGDKAALRRFKTFAVEHGLEVVPEEQVFPDRVVTIVRASPRDLTGSLEVLNDFTELRRAQFPSGLLRELPAWEQAMMVRDLAARLVPPPQTAPAVAVLDTGVAREHPALSPALAETDVHAHHPDAWGVHDHAGHGTQVAGLALLGDFGPHLGANGPVVLRHRLESVKILPPGGENPAHLYGDITARSVARAEVAAPRRSRVILVTTTTTDQDYGRPSTWSAEVDRLAAGADNPGARSRRLFVLAAGNRQAPPASRDCFAANLESGIQAPGQSWNAVTVGAYTELDRVRGDAFQGWEPAVAPGDLSPHTTTSCPWVGKGPSISAFKGAPLKPDVVAEGGSLAVAPDGAFDQPDSMCLLTSHHRLIERHFDLMDGTSAAAALVARMAAQIQAEYPDAWPETVRALLIHSAQWTQPMRAHLHHMVTGSPAGPFDLGGPHSQWLPRTIQGVRVRQEQKELLLRACGYGVPDLGRAVASATNRLTLVVQETISPFEAGHFKEIHLHKLPWPAEVLASLHDTPVEMRVTLSYFVEPNPARRGGRNRFSYQSFGLRFDVKTASETPDEFHIRLNQEAREEEQGALTRGDSSDWNLGRKLRSRGSIHSDVWKGTAVELASRGHVAVFPVVGWWRDRRDAEGRTARYALVISIDTPRVDADIYTPVENLVRIPIEV